MLQPSIQTFIKVADCGSFSAAAEQLYISKVSVMNQINSLEGHVGVPLFVRTNKGIILTDAGKSFYKNAQKIVRLSNHAILEARQISGIKSKSIRIGTSMMRPCNPLVELWEQMVSQSNEYTFDIVPFNDDVGSMTSMLSNLGKTIDCFVTPCASTNLLMNYNFLPFSSCKCEVAMSKKHPLAKKKILAWEDLHGESLLLIKRGDSYVLDELRDDILCNHPDIHIRDFDGYYDVSTFNLCEQKGYLMETMDMWASLHPSLITIPVRWHYEMPYGILYAKNTSDTMEKFIRRFSNITHSVKEL